MKLTLLRGDIAAQRVDVIVNAASTALLGGGGVDGVIHHRGGPEILRECRALRAGALPKGLPAGQAVATTAGNLPARWVVHTVGPVWRAGADRSATLRDCYTNSLRVATGLGAVSVAFPLLSSGAFAWPVPDAIRQALTAIAASDFAGEVRLVLYDEQTRRTAERIRAEADEQPQRDERPQSNEQPQGNEQPRPE